MVIYQISKRNLKLQYVNQVEDLCKVNRLINGSIQMTNNVTYRKENIEKLEGNMIYLKKKSKYVVDME